MIQVCDLYILIVLESQIPVLGHIEVENFGQNLGDDRATFTQMKAETISYCKVNIFSDM